MLTKEFNYHLPSRLIAQNPVSPRDHSRLMVLDREKKEIKHCHFYDLPQILRKGDVLVFNRSKVIPARLYGEMIPRSVSSKGKKIEVLLVKKVGPKRWEALVKPGRKFKKGVEIIFGTAPKIFKARVFEVNPDGSRILQFNLGGKKLERAIGRGGHAPLPPYLKYSKATLEQYQTIYAKEKGSVAAPTAGLHFTPELFQALKQKEIQLEFLTLCIGRGTFEPVKTEEIEKHQMHKEWFSLSLKTAQRLKRAKKQGRRIIAVGTTSLRVLETCASENRLIPKSGETNLFIYPGYQFRFVDALITNFHLPKSTLLMLVSALAGKTFIEKAYQTALAKKYRFYSFGDAMLIF